MGGKGYIGTGQDINGLKKDFWEYDPTTNTWTKKTDFGGTARRLAVGFAIGHKGYIGTGDDGGFKNDFWEYDQITNIWKQKNNFGGIPRNGAVGFSNGSKGYIGTGYGNTLANTKDFWEYDPTTDTWDQKDDFAGSARANAVGFAIGTACYIGTGYDSIPRKDFWEYGLPVGINDKSDVKKYSFRIFPNPMTESAAVSLSPELNLQNAELSIYNMEGKKVDQMINLKTNEFTIHRNQLSPGIYILKVFCDNKIIGKEKIIIK